MTVDVYMVKEEKYSIRKIKPQAAWGPHRMHIHRLVSLDSTTKKRQCEDNMERFTSMGLSL